MYKRYTPLRALKQLSVKKLSLHQKFLLERARKNKTSKGDDWNRNCPTWTKNTRLEQTSNPQGGSDHEIRD